MYNRILFYPKVSDRDSYGASVDTYPTVTINTRGEVRHTGGSKTLSGEEKFYSRSKEIIIWYRDGIDETMRVKIDGDNNFYEITYIEPLGRREKLRIVVDKLNL